MKLKFGFVGPDYGKTRLINGFQFVNGFFTLNDTPESVAGVTAYLAHYQAYPVGSDEYEAGMEKYGHGKRDIQAGGAPEVQGQGVSDGSGPNSSSATGFDGPSDPQGDQGEQGTDRSGHEDSGLVDEQESDGQDDQSEAAEAVQVKAGPKVAEAVYKLDAMNDDHWTDAGLPAMAAVEAALGSTGITRRDVAAAVPGWDREKALEAAARAL